MKKNFFHGKKIYMTKTFLYDKKSFHDKTIFMTIFFISGTLLFPSSTAKSGFPFFTTTKSTFGIMQQTQQSYLFEIHIWESYQIDFAKSFSFTFFCRNKETKEICGNVIFVVVVVVVV